MTHANAVTCLGGEQTTLQPFDTPAPGPGELLLDLRVVGFCGTDMFKLVTGAAAPGTVLGHEIVGEVAAIGPGVEGFAPGDRVAVPHHVPCGECALCRRGAETMCDTFRENLLFPGGFADRILVRPRATAQAAQKLPDHVSDEAAVFLEPGACVLRSVHKGELPREGGLAVVQGGGSMGLLHLLIIRAALPGTKVLVVDPVAERMELAVSLGAAAAAPPGEAAQAAVGELSEGLGADAVFDTVGGAGPLRAALTLSRQGGTVVLFAHAGPDEPADFPINDLFKFERRIVGAYSGALGEQREVFDLLRSGALDPTPLVTHRLPLDRFAEGVELVRQRKALKVLYTPSNGKDRD
ncbi:zinc-dependent alcohol dehydrogenase [Roseospirillum parvum]|uniref:L-iditol 2-dehydrogenase n=1 Tax=Roseospirillum parvum TaxID=83401 RepID=A0A1G7XSG7_9PROT|nr:alcohol dehydrogenase catalytic domain-containing protein [Roseospirillum parvum]SDG87064.1 L-iditol 2-dehydrogenase [Roseospirillum parvum]